MIVSIVVAYGSMIVYNVGKPLMVGSPYYDSIQSILALSLIAAMSYTIVSATSLGYPSHILTDHKESRLCFKIILSVLEKCVCNSGAQHKLLAKNARYFRTAFSSFGSSLVNRPYNLELKNIDKYHNAVYTVAVLGNHKEIEQTSESIHSLLNTMGEKLDKMKLRESITTLTKLVHENPDHKATALEFSELWRVSTRLERIKIRLKSPIITFIVTIVFGVLTLLGQYISK